jgi:hypothetical protein
VCYQGKLAAIRTSPTGALNQSRNIDGRGLITESIDGFLGVQATAGRLPATMKIIYRYAEPARWSLRITM